MLMPCPANDPTKLPFRIYLLFHRGESRPPPRTPSVFPRNIVNSLASSPARGRDRQSGARAALRNSGPPLNSRRRYNLS